ncbi:MAG: GntG family PLP-dependent aldolase [Planctomycetota bacterium]
MKTRDFRSDTVTKPTPQMLRAMVEAEVGDDVLEGDPTVRRLEQRVADWLGKPGALFVPSGTMANQCAIGTWTRPGDEMIAERSAHVVQWESGAAAANHGVQTQTLVAEDGVFEPEALKAAFRYPSLHCPLTKLVCTEQSFMGSGQGAGGRVVPYAAMQSTAEVCGDAGIPVHLDGARLANAVVASGIAAADWALLADSVSVCFSKGLGAPVGSAIAGDEEFLERAKIVRKRLGGWMRQSGILAAAALYALDNNVERLAEDHDNAKLLARLLGELPGLSCDESEVQTNIVMVRTEDPRFSPADLAARLAERGIQVLPLSHDSLRFVTHLDVDEEDVHSVRDELERILGLQRIS